MRVTVLSDVDPADGRDAVVDQVADALRGRHEVEVLEIHDDLDVLARGLREQRPDLVFNLCEMFGEDAQADARVAAVLELLQVPFTGSGAAELFLVQDEGVTKKLLAFESILYPNFAVFTPDADIETGGNLRMPLFVKPLRGDASIGITGSDALIRDSRSLMEQVLRIHDEQKDAALAEEHIEGRELYVGVLGNRAGGAAADRARPLGAARPHAAGGRQRRQVRRGARQALRYRVARRGPARRAAGEAAEGGRAGLPRAARARLRARRPAAHRGGGDLCARR